MRLIPTRAAWLAPVVFCCAVGPQLAAAHIPIPPRAPSPYVGPEPWPGFRPWTEGARDLPLEPAARWDRWRAYRQGAVPSLDHRMRAATPAPEVTRSPRQESRQFQEGFEAALAAARDNRVEETLQRVRDLQPETLAGIERVRRLWFAAAVAGSEMAMAESLFYRLSWDDGGRTATRLAAWRELASGSGARAAELLSGLGARTPGEHVAAGIGRWMQSAASVGNLPDAPGDAPTPRAGWTLLAAQERLLAGDRAGAAALLDEAPDMAPAWASVRDELRELASGQDRNLSGADRLLVESLSRKFEAAAWPQVVDESGS